MAATPARQAAFQILLRVETRSSYAAELLHSSLVGRLSAEDRRLATELVLGVLRWRGQLDFLAEKFSGRSVASLDTEVALALRLGLYQLRFLEKIPGHAAVNESVELVKKAGKRSAAGFVNAVLRKATSAPISQLLPRALSPLERLAILHSHPGWLLERWTRHFGEERALALAQENNAPARTALRLLLQRAARNEILASLARDGIKFAPSDFLSDCVIVTGGAVRESKAFRRGWIRIQDEASQMVGWLVGAQPGERVLDLCAAPGGKTAQLAEAAGRRGLVVASDVHLSRLRRLRSLLGDESSVMLVQLDGREPLPFNALFDRILVDAPCSGTGTLARNPEIKWRLKPDSLSQLHRFQVELLRQAARALGPGGRLVYSTCSLEPEENESVLDSVLAAEKNLELVPAARDLESRLTPDAPLATLFDARGCFRTFPPTHHADGFFAAAITKRQSGPRA